MLILGQLCGGLSTIQMVCVGVGWVVLGCGGDGGVGLVVGWLSSFSSFFYVLLLGCCGCWGREVVWQRRDKKKRSIIINSYSNRVYLHSSKYVNIHIFNSLMSVVLRENCVNFVTFCILESLVWMLLLLHHFSHANFQLTIQVVSWLLSIM